MPLLPWQRAVWNPIRRPSLRVRMPRLRATRTRRVPVRPVVQSGGSPAPVRVDVIERPGVTIRVIR